MTTISIHATTKRPGALSSLWRRLSVVPWLTALPLAAVMAYAEGFWMVSLRGAVGAIERTQQPFATWLRESTLALPLFTLAVLGALTLAARPLATRHQREHQWVAAPALSEGHRPECAQQRRPGLGRRRAQRPAPQTTSVQEANRTDQTAPVALTAWIRRSPFRERAQRGIECASRRLGVRGERLSKEGALHGVCEPGFVLGLGPSAREDEAFVRRGGAEAGDDVGGMLRTQPGP